MLSKNALSKIQKLHQKKYRNQEALFFIETPKIVRDFFESDFFWQQIYCTEDFLPEVPTALRSLVTLIDEQDLAKISALEAPQKVLAVLHQKQNFLPLHFEKPAFLLDKIQDPANLGALIRIAAWFDMPYLFCSEETAEFYHPKTLQASMGNLARVSLIRVNIIEFLASQKEQKTIVGTFLSGKNYQHFRPEKPLLIVLGNEGQGISQAVSALVHEKITIPKLGFAESLNVAVVGGILAAHFCLPQN